MRELLQLFTKPAFYAGIEEGAIIREPKTVSLHMALAFPDVYEVGMSYLGHKILYGIINSNPHWYAERAMAPDREVADILRKYDSPLCTLETDTPLGSLDAVGFSITHELCYTDVLHMLDLAHIPLRAASRGDRLDQYPLIMAGGGAILGAEPLMPFLDVAVLGDGEETMPDILRLLEEALAKGWSKSKFLHEARHIPGIYVPSLFAADANGLPVSVYPDYRPARRIVSDLNKAVYPLKQVIPVGAVHDRLVLEIARGCVRGCRFCHAGMIYRPLRERNLETIDNLLDECIRQNGFEEVTFLALSAGDYSALKTLCARAWSRCAKEQITLSLPSLRAGSIDDDIMAQLASIRRTGTTLAPEAASQRLRDVINKGISEEDIIGHAQKLLAHGWRQAKLYFMIGLPTETEEDLIAIMELCRKVRDAGGPGAPKLQVTASLSPFVPKPFTPFQWAAQIDRDEIHRRIQFVLNLFRKEKCLTLRWHSPDVSHLEGILSRGGRELADVIEKAYRKGAIFCSWAESFKLEPWLEALAECGFSAEKLIAARPLDEPLPWSHIESGIDEKFLRMEWQRAHQAIPTPPCSANSCRQCGACDTKARASLLPHTDGQKHGLRQVYDQRDQSNNALPAQNQYHVPSRPSLNPMLANKAAHYRIWHLKTGGCAFLSQLELQDTIMRALRRANIPVAFSQGYHPMPLLSFGRALPVGVQSLVEWFALTLYMPVAPDILCARLNAHLNKNLAANLARLTEKQNRNEQAAAEEFLLEFKTDSLVEMAAELFDKFTARESFILERKGKKGLRQTDIRPMLLKWNMQYNQAGLRSIKFCTDWHFGYISPMQLLFAILADLGEPQMLKTAISLCKTAQIFADGSRYMGNKNMPAGKLFTICA